MSKVFIDTNIFLRFYKVNTDDLETIFKDILKLKTSIVLVDQVSDEFLRNRDHLFSEQINKLGTKYKSNSNLTPFIKSLEEFSELAEAGKVVVKKHEKLVKKLKHIKDNIDKDTVYKNFYMLYNDSELTKYERTDDIIDKAHRRMLMGNPPIDSKKNTIGDQIIWETLISNLDDDLIFITDDSTYESNVSFLKNEYATKSHKKLIVTDKVSFALDQIGETSSQELINFEISRKYNDFIEEEEVKDLLTQFEIERIDISPDSLYSFFELSEDYYDKFKEAIGITSEIEKRYRKDGHSIESDFITIYRKYFNPVYSPYIEEDGDA